MASRNRTALFIKYRDHCHSSYGASRLGRSNEMCNMQKKGLLNASDLEDGLQFAPPGWVQHIDTTNTIIVQLREKIAELSKLHSKHLLPSFDDKADEEEEIRNTTADINLLFHQGEKAIKAIDSYGNEDDLKLRKNARISLATQLHEQSTNFRKEQSRYKQRLQGQEATQQEFSLPNDPAFDDCFDPGFSTSQLAIVDTQHDISSERAREIDEIAKSVTDLAMIFKELAELVIDQGTIIDRIDYNIECTANNTNDALKQLIKAEEHQKKGGLTACIACLLVAIGVLVIALIFKWSS